jgi:hypothetical protein
MGIVCDRIDGIDNPIATREDILQASPSSADLIRAFPLEAAILSPQMTIPLQVATGRDVLSSRHGMGTVCERSDDVNDSIAAREKMREPGPSSANCLWPFPPKTAVFASEMAVPLQVAARHYVGSTGDMFGKVCHRIDGIYNPIATREDVFQTGPSSADHFWSVPSETAIFAAYVAIPPQIATG